MKNVMLVESGHASIATGHSRIVTMPLTRGRPVKVYGHNNDFPTLCHGASFAGAKLVYSTDAQLARDCEAKLYKTREAFDEAVAALEAASRHGALRLN